MNTPIVKVFTDIRRCGFPFLYNYNFDDSGVQQYLSSLYDSIVLKNIKTLCIRNCFGETTQ